MDSLNALGDTQAVDTNTMSQSPSEKALLVAVRCIAPHLLDVAFRFAWKLFSRLLPRHPFSS